jgi:cyclophilin family peptidyl-prolyl cis-trans isomerase
MPTARGRSVIAAGVDTPMRPSIRPSTALVRSLPAAKLMLGASLVCVSGCMGEAKNGDVPAKTAVKDVKPAKGDAKKPDAKTADAKTDAKADAKKPDAKAPDAKADPAAPKTFDKGALAKPNMTPDEVAAYNAAQGDPRKGPFTIADATAGDDKLAPGKGKLTAIFDTTMGKFECELYEDKAPLTVANFVGLARGVRESYDKKSDAWTAKKFYDGVIFHRVIDGFMIQTGDPTGTGGGGPGYVVLDEFDKSLKHTTPGLLSMANRGPNTGSSQFFVTVAPTPHLDGKHTIFGKCDPAVPTEISKVKVDARANHRPYEQVSIKTIEIVRK